MYLVRVERRAHNRCGVGDGNYLLLERKIQAPPGRGEVAKDALAEKVT